MTAASKQTQQQIRGNSAEALAKHYLTAQGLDFVQANYRCKTGEIDLIFWHNDALVFVEVRYRQELSHGTPLDSVTGSKQRKLKRAVQFYLQRQFGDHWPACRFDVIGIAGNLNNSPEICWVQHAFY